jgi:hypothetical protein
MDPLLFLLAFAVGLILGYFLLLRTRKSRFYAKAEYWVYIPQTQLPDQSAAMDRIVGANPYASKGRSPIGPKEGLILSDVRLHISLVRRQKNPHLFRPDLFQDAEFDAEMLAALARSQALIVLRYVSEDPLPDLRHLQFLLHAADAYAELAGGEVVLDTVSDRVWTRPELAAVLAAQPDVTHPEAHVRVLWQPVQNGFRAVTKGLLKRGLRELTTDAMEPDERLLVVSVLEEAVRRFWKEPDAPSSIDLPVFDDLFRVEIGNARRLPADAPVPVRILRLRNA